jgi:hypothetical protein
VVGVVSLKEMPLYMTLDCDLHLITAVKQACVRTTWALKGTSPKCVGVAEDDHGLITGSSSESGISRIKRIANHL